MLLDGRWWSGRHGGCSDNAGRLSMSAEVERFSAGAEWMTTALPGLLALRATVSGSGASGAMEEAGVPEGLAHRVAGLDPLFGASTSPRCRRRGASWSRRWRRSTTPSGNGSTCWLRTQINSLPTTTAGRPGAGGAARRPVQPAEGHHRSGAPGRRHWPGAERADRRLARTGRGRCSPGLSGGRRHQRRRHRRPRQPLSGSARVIASLPRFWTAGLGANQILPPGGEGARCRSSG